MSSVHEDEEDEDEEPAIRAAYEYVLQKLEKTLNTVDRRRSYSPDVRKIALKNYENNKNKIFLTVIFDREKNFEWAYWVKPDFGIGRQLKTNADLKNLLASNSLVLELPKSNTPQIIFRGKRRFFYSISDIAAIDVVTQEKSRAEQMKALENIGATKGLVRPRPAQEGSRPIPPKMCDSRESLRRALKPSFEENRVFSEDAFKKDATVKCAGPFKQGSEQYDMLANTLLITSQRDNFSWTRFVCREGVSTEWINDLAFMISSATDNDYSFYVRYVPAAAGKSPSPSAPEECEGIVSVMICQERENDVYIHLFCSGVAGGGELFEYALKKFPPTTEYLELQTTPKARSFYERYGFEPKWDDGTVRVHVRVAQGMTNFYARLKGLKNVGKDVGLDLLRTLFPGDDDRSIGVKPKCLLQEGESIIVAPVRVFFKTMDGRELDAPKRLLDYDLSFSKNLRVNQVLVAMGDATGNGYNNFVTVRDFFEILSSILFDTTKVYESSDSIPELAWEYQIDRGEDATEDAMKIFLV